MIFPGNQPLARKIIEAFHEHLKHVGTDSFHTFANTFVLVFDNIPIKHERNTKIIYGKNGGSLFEQNNSENVCLHILTDPIKRNDYM